ncbi:hypothetical protein M407DRAFT_20535 [Tulasnella calospora MUT 4182]|uniref:Uncharacterized protein n=1 Tax=Tulasnella calospora MUT 4182 TaxID=1051891 RepID=A0A0C3QQ10_9AGAM|nr:hypothetical protein M407DRAFT_20535 [Tulasnella calospora MUT 4182]
MPEQFPVPFDTPDCHHQTALTLQDLKLQAMSYNLRSKPSWWTKYKDETIRSKWKAEALAAPVIGIDKLLEPEVDYVLDELAGYEKLRDDATGIQASLLLSPSGDGSSLKEAVKVLENVPEDRKDWHPRSEGQVLDLVHPSLYPIVYGRTLRYPEGTKPEERKVEDFWPVIAPDRSVTPGEDWAFSDKFAWLSTDFKIAEDGSSAKAVSYINNLHPSHTELYSIIEALVARFSFLFDRVLTDLSNYYESWHLRIIGDYTFENDDEEKPEQEEEEEDEEYETRIATWNMQRSITLPTVPPKGYTMDISNRPKTYTIRGKEAQIIVKLANIHLTPEKPVYPGGSWHVEGMVNERIIASGIYYYDSENISESELQFRAVVSAEDLDYEQSDALGIMRVWGITRESGGNQPVGATPTHAGRCLAFPNIYQHKVSPFELVDKMKPGHRKIVAFFLVDPENPRFSTTDIPPQQAEWYEDAMQQAPPTSLLRKLPAELVRETTRQLPNLMTLDEAKKYRLELMDERTAFVETQDEMHFKAEFNFCEH